MAPGTTVASRRRNGDAEPTVSVHTPRGLVASAITAAASRWGQSPQPVSQSQARTPQWQLDSLAYYDQIGAVRYAAQFWSRGLSKIRFYAAERDEKGEIKETKNERVIETFERVQDPEGGTTAITTTYGQLRFLTGECYLIWSPGERRTDPEEWEVVSTLELRKLSRRGGRETWHRIEAPGLTPQELVEADDKAFEPMAKEVIVYRLWKRHPAYSRMADAPMRSVLADCEEIVRCTHTINARLISRLSGPGIFAIPSSWKVKPLTQVAGEQNPEEDPFQTRLTQAMIAAIGTPGSAESVAPIVVKVPDGTTGDAHLYKIWDPNEVIREIDLREKAVHRYAVGVDMPPAKVEGIQDANHWNAWALDKEAMEHLEPVAVDFAGDLTSAYLRPTLRQGKVEDADKYLVWYDAAAAVTNPDEFGDALKLYEARAVGKAYLRRTGNAQDTDAMSDDELAEAIFIATSQKVEVKGGVLDLEPEPVPPELGGPPTGEDTDPDMPDEPDADTADDAPAVSAAAVAVRADHSEFVVAVMAQAELALLDIRGRVGMRVRNALAGGKCAECVEQVRDVHASQIVAALGQDVIASNELDLAGYAEGAGDTFGLLLQGKGATYAQSRAIQEVLELHAVASIYDTAPGLPPGFAGHVRTLRA